MRAGRARRGADATDDHGEPPRKAAQRAPFDVFFAGLAGVNFLVGIFAFVISGGELPQALGVAWPPLALGSLFVLAAQRKRRGGGSGSRKSLIVLGPLCSIAIWALLAIEIMQTGKGTP